MKPITINTHIDCANNSKCSVRDILLAINQGASFVHFLLCPHNSNNDVADYLHYRLNLCDKLYTKEGKIKECKVGVCSRLTKGGQLNGISNSSWEVSAQVTESPVTNRGRCEDMHHVSMDEQTQQGFVIMVINIMPLMPMSASQVMLMACNGDMVMSCYLPMILGFCCFLCRLFFLICG